ncbi:hypothetical protein [Variovorax sp. GT1P44]|uniref:hypothetical protein n=1 Tax=Variovorax sp. GT1P44 TaxID=3443742 RepID=UPI003F47D930
MQKARFHSMPKEQMKELEGLSPDLWDTVCMAFLEDVHYIEAEAEATGPREATGKQAVVNSLTADLEAALGL